MTHATVTSTIAEISQLVGKTITAIKEPTLLIDEEQPQEELCLDKGCNIYFVCNDGMVFLMTHDQSCCESVNLTEIHGDLNWLIGSPIVLAEERIQENQKSEDDWNSSTWTFYEIATVKGSVTMRWVGTSNGYYSESVDLKWLTELPTINECGQRQILQDLDAARYA